MIPIIQKELEEFKNTVWNTHRIRFQKETVLPDGMPEHIYSFPEKYGLEECGKVLLVNAILESDQWNINFAQVFNFREEILAGRNFGELTHPPNSTQFGGIYFGECHQ